MAPRAKKAAPKKKAVRKKKASTELATMDQWEKRMAEAAVEQSSKEQVGSGNVISTRNGKFSYQGTTIGTEMDVIVLGFSHTRGYYEGDFDVDNPQPPACFAISLDGLEETPHPDSPEPQAELCAECDWDAWGSAEKGDGKRCRQHRRLAIMSYQDDLSEADVATVNVSPSSIKNWKGYLKKIEKQLHRPCFGVITNIHFDPDADYATMLFEMVDVVSDPADMAIIFDQVEEIEDLLMQAPDVSNYEKAAPKKKRGRAAPKKKVARRKKKF